jgi:hypothetical protein
MVGPTRGFSAVAKKSSEEINMLAASNTLDEILRGTKGIKKRKPLKAYYYDLEGEIKYILYKEDNETYYDTLRLRDPQGRLHKQEETPIMGTLIPTAQWGDGHTHVQFPRPKEYTLGVIGFPLDRISVKQLTLELSKNKRTAHGAQGVEPENDKHKTNTPRLDHSSRQIRHLFPHSQRCGHPL